MVNVIWIILVLLSIWFIYVFGKDIIENKNNLEKVSWIKTGFIGFIVNFFDVLGIGAFAPQTALLKFTKQTSDKLIPGTMNVANTLPVLIQAIIFIQGFMFANKMHWIQGEGVAIGIYGWKLVIAGLVNFILGAMMTAGVGLYAPCMALVYLLGLSPQVAFPIMMGSCAFLMPPASFKFIKSGNYNKKAALGMAIPSIFAVLIAAFIIKSLPLDTLRWLVMIIIIYTSVTMFLAAIKNK
jgi:uncharacterized membrane protein YfcA